MDQNSIKTSTGQRIFIAIIAFIMVGSIITSYILIILSNGSTTTSSENELDPAIIQAYYEGFVEAGDALSSATQSDYNKFIEYKSRITAYNETAANNSGLQVKDLKTGSGHTLTDGDYDYLAYYVGWCANEEVFDSTLDDASSPSKFSSILTGSADMVEGWNQGIIGMKLGGIREITIPGELAYANSQEICGGYNMPIKFIVMLVANEDPLKSVAEAYSLAQNKYYYAAYYGIDYDTVFSSATVTTEEE